MLARAANKSRQRFQRDTATSQMYSPDSECRRVKQQQYWTSLCEVAYTRLDKIGRDAIPVLQEKERLQQRAWTSYFDKAYLVARCELAARVRFRCCRQSLFWQAIPASR